MPIAINYKGEESYKTSLGGIISCLTYLFIFSYSYQKILNLVNRDDANVSYFNIYRPQNEEFSYNATDI